MLILRYDLAIHEDDSLGYRRTTSISAFAGSRSISRNIETFLSKGLIAHALLRERGRKKSKNSAI